MPAWSVVKYFTHNPGVLDSSRTEFSGKVALNFLLQRKRLYRKVRLTGKEQH